jgi:hypothetical protein
MKHRECLRIDVRWHVAGADRRADRALDRGAQQLVGLDKGGVDSGTRPIDSPSSS